MVLLTAKWQQGGVQVGAAQKPLRNALRRARQHGMRRKGIFLPTQTKLPASHTAAVVWQRLTCRWLICSGPVNMPGWNPAITCNDAGQAAQRQQCSYNMYVLVVEARVVCVQS